MKNQSQYKILKQEMQRLEKLEVQRLAAPDQQISLTDPDARSMAMERPRERYGGL